MAHSLKFRNLHAKMKGVRCLPKHLLSYYCFCQEHIYIKLISVISGFSGFCSDLEFSVEEQRPCFPHQLMFW